MPDRIAALTDWLEHDCGLAGVRLEAASGDASFRRYFRVFMPGQETRIVMDAPPERERPADFVRLAGQLSAIGVHAPRVDACDLQRGFVLLEDLGDTLYLDVIDDDNADRLYGEAITALLTMQRYAPVAGLPDYDRDLLLREMQLFPEWLAQRHLGVMLSERETAQLAGVFDWLADSALEQPRTFVHRDFHSRNLLCSAAPPPGVIDFQDAVVGPVTYDLVSLLRDCYIAWPRARVTAWVRGYFERAVHAGILDRSLEAPFERWFDLMGVQRHLKAAGIFARLRHRDGKHGYLADIPRTLGHVVEVAARYRQLAPLAALTDRLLTAMARLPDDVRGTS